MNRLHPFTFDEEKSVEVILYIARRAQISDLIHICKILYFADKEHLKHYGRFICGDYYVAMKNGPVPSGTYDIMKAVKAGRPGSYSAAFMVYEDFRVRPFRDANIDLMSESDVEALDQAIKAYGSMSIGNLIDAGHDAAWHDANENSMMSIESIAKTLENANEIIDYLRS